MLNKNLWISGLVTGVAATSVVVATLALAPASTSTVAGNAVLGGDRPRLSVLERTVNDGDMVPAAILKLPVAERFSDVTAARNVGAVDNRTYYLIPGVGDTVCLIFVGQDFGPDKDRESGGSCAALSAAMTAGVYVIGDDGSDEYSVAVVAPDGISSVTAGDTTQRVSNNVAIFSTKDPSTLLLTNDALRASTTIETGPQSP